MVLGPVAPKVLAPVAQTVLERGALYRRNGFVLAAAVGLL